jgi:signal recognition particle GTPase
MTPIRQRKPKQPTVVVIAGPNGAGKSTAAQAKITQALKLASANAKKQLAAHRLKLPTQSWTDSVVRNPAV